MLAPLRFEEHLDSPLTLFVGRLHYFQLTLVDLCILCGLTCESHTCDLEADTKLDLKHSAQPYG